MALSTFRPDVNDLFLAQLKRTKRGPCDHLQATN